LELRSQPELMHTWRGIRAELRAAVGESTFHIWLEPLKPSEWDGRVLTLAAPRDTKTWITERFSGVIERCVQSVFGPTARVSFTTVTESRTSTRAASRARRDDDAVHQLCAPSGSFNPRHSFEQFVMGDSNHLAHTAALAVAENPSQAINPLFLYGPPGLGKTHLLHAIGNYLAAYSPDTVVRYATVEAFTTGFISALGSRTVERFKQLYRGVDVLLIDDVQFLASKAKTEEEFFHTFNAIYDTGRQLVLTCDRLPTQLVGIEERLRDRFQSGLVAEISAPDHATRAAILRKRAALDGLEFKDPAVLELIAESTPDNIRSLEGALIRVVAVHSLTGRELDHQLAAEVLASIRPTRDDDRRQLTLDRIQQVVADHFALNRSELCSPSRAAKVMWPRQLAIHLARELTGQSLQSIGHAFGGRNHATALHACRRVSEQVRVNPESASQLAALLNALEAGHRGRNDRRD